jgi:hypothetical protein
MGLKILPSVGVITGFAKITITPISGIAIQIRKAWTFNDNPHFLIHRADCIMIAEVFVLARKLVITT